MKQTVNFNRFCDGFGYMDRENQFTYRGRRALFDYLEEYEASTGEEIELDVIALCCEYTEYENLAGVQEDYDDIKSLDDLEEHTTVIRINAKSFIIQNY